MKYIENPFKVGQYVQCINDSFPAIITTGDDKSNLGILPDSYPKIGEVCCVDEILGEYLRFDEYDCYDPNHPDYGWRWWIHTHFNPISLDEVEEHYEKIGNDFIQSIHSVLNK